MKRCEVCRESPAKYKCPRCLTQSCSLPCVKKHKADRDCNGERDKTAHIAVKKFTDMDLLSDYRFLEEAGRKTSNASRDSLKRTHRQPVFLKDLQKRARHRHIDLKLMPYPMSRRKNNSTTYVSRLKSILWQIQWNFPHVDVSYTDIRVSENEVLRVLLQKYVDPREAEPLVRHRLAPYCRAGAEDIRLVMKVENTPCHRKRYHLLNAEETLVENLRNKQVLEHPCISVVLREHWDEYPVVEDTEVKTDTVNSGSSCNTGEAQDNSERMLAAQTPSQPTQNTRPVLDND